MLVGGAMDKTSDSGPEDSRFDSQLAIGLLAQFVSNVTFRAHELVSILGPVMHRKVFQCQTKGKSISISPLGFTNQIEKRESESLSLNVVTGKAGEWLHVMQKCRFCVFRSPRVKEQGWTFRRRVQAVFIRVVIGREMERHSSR